MAGQTRRVETALGTIDYVLTVKAVKHINLRLSPGGTVAVSVPRRVPASMADDFVRSRADWIFNHLDRQREKRSVLTPPDRNKALPVLTAAVERMYPLVAPLGVKMPTVRARFMTSRWGSCHWTKGVITLNTALAAVEEGLLDYVALHELVHFLHPDHGPGFYQVMDRLMPGWRERRRRLTGYGLSRGKD